MDRNRNFVPGNWNTIGPNKFTNYNDAVDIDDYDNPMRAVPLIATGVG